MKKALKKLSHFLGIRLLTMGCCMVRGRGIGLREEEVKNLKYQNVKNLVAVTAHYDDCYVSPPYGLTIEIKSGGKYVNIGK